MLRLWGVWRLGRERWESRNLYSAKQDAVNRAAVMSFKCEAKPFGDFVQVTPEVVEAAKRTDQLDFSPFPADVQRILLWLAQAVRMGDGNDAANRT